MWGGPDVNWLVFFGVLRLGWAMRPGNPGASNTDAAIDLTCLLAGAFLFGMAA